MGDLPMTAQVSRLRLIQTMLCTVLDGQTPETVNAQNQQRRHGGFAACRPPCPMSSTNAGHDDKEDSICEFFKHVSDDPDGYATPKVKDLDNNFKSRADQIDNRLGQITLTQVPGGYCYVDAQTGKSSAVETYKEVAQGQMEAYQGSIRLAMWDRLTKEFGLVGITEEEITVMQKTLDAWEETQKNTAPI